MSEPPRYSVINARPSVSDCIREFSLQEWGVWAGLTAASATWGYAIGNLNAPVAAVLPRREHLCSVHAEPRAARRPLIPPYRTCITARPRRVRHPSMVFAGAVGFTGAMCHGIIQAQVDDKRTAVARLRIPFSYQIHPSPLPVLPVPLVYVSVDIRSCFLRPVLCIASTQPAVACAPMRPYLRSRLYIRTIALA